MAKICMLSTNHDVCPRGVVAVQSRAWKRTSLSEHCYYIESEHGLTKGVYQERAWISNAGGKSARVPDEKLIDHKRWNR